MPRGPGKKQNYNLDYSRFNGADLDDEDKEELRLQELKNAKAAKAREASGSPAAGQGPSPEQMQEAMARMPPELREAYRLMAIAKASGDKAAEQRASELAIHAVQNGTPQIREEFVKNMEEQLPGMGDQLRKELMGDAINRDPSKILDSLSEQPEPPATIEGIENKLNSLKENMEKGAASTKRQMERLQRQQEELENMRTPEDFVRFMQGEGLSDEDMQRMFSGDMKHMESCVQGMLDKAVQPAQDGKLEDTEEAVKAAEALHSAICGDGSVTYEPSTGKTKSAGGSSSEKAQAEPPKKKVVKKAPAEPQVQIPIHRLQYQKDEGGQYIAVELKCNLPGVANMAAIALDVSEKHMRLNTCAPAPLYAVNAGPFPVLIDPTRASAKYSKKREELSICVPAKGAAD